MKKVTLVLVTILLAATIASAATQPSEREFSIFGDYTHTPTKSVGSDDAAGLGLGVSQYVTNEISLGLQGWRNWGSRGNATDLGINGKYHFMPMNPINPYVGGQLNYVQATTLSGGHMKDGVVWGPLFGVSFSVADKTSLYVEYQYQIGDGGIRHYATEAEAIVIGMSFGF